MQLCKAVKKLMHTSTYMRVYIITLHTGK